MGPRPGRVRQTYTTALLADLTSRTDPDHPEARTWADTAWAAIQRDVHPNLLPLIGLHRAATLLHTADDDPATVEAPLRTAVAMDAWGTDHDQDRIRIMALALSAEAHTRLGHQAAADLASATALTLLVTTGSAPALDMVVVLYRCALARPTRAERDRVMAQARAAVADREAGISPQRRATYRAQPLVRAVLAADEPPTPTAA